MLGGVGGGTDDVAIATFEIQALDGKSMYGVFDTPTFLSGGGPS